MALAHKRLRFERQAVAFTAIPTLRDRSHKTVPILDDDGTIVSDSFAIARYLETTYPDRPSLFGGPGGEAASRFVERWTQLGLQALLMRFIVNDINDRLAPKDQSYFRPSREKRLGMKLEDAVADREQRLPALRAALEPLRSMLSHQPFIGGEAPLLADYIVFGALQWARVTSPFALLDRDDPVAIWFERCLDLHGGIARRTPAADESAAALAI